MHVKIVALADEDAVKSVLDDPDYIPKASSEYDEIIFFHPKAVYGAPDLYAIRVWGEKDESAVLVHLGHDLRDQDEKEVDKGHKNDLEYRLLSLGYVPLANLKVREYRGRYKEFFVRILGISDFWFVIVERDARDTEEFEERQKRACSFLRQHGISKILDVDARAFILIPILERNGLVPKEAV